MNRVVHRGLGDTEESAGAAFTNQEFSLLELLAKRARAQPG